MQTNETKQSPRHEYIDLQSSGNSTTLPKTYIGEKTAPSINGAGNTRCPHVGELSQIYIYKLAQNQLQINQRPKYET